MEVGSVGGVGLLSSRLILLGSSGFLVEMNESTRGISQRTQVSSSSLVSSSIRFVIRV